MTDLRYRTHDVLQSLDRGESVVITFRGKTLWIQRGNRRAAQLVQNAPSRFLSIQTYTSSTSGRSPCWNFNR